VVVALETDGDGAGPADHASQRDRNAMNRALHPVGLAFLLLGGSACVATPIVAPTPAPHSVAAESSDVEPTATPASLATLRAAPDLLPFTTAVAEAVADWRPPPYPVPWSLRPEDHFFFARPIPSGEVNWPNPAYRYGATYSGQQSTHTEVDLGAVRDAPVLAAAAGEVVWTGYGLYRGLPDPNDPYGLAIAVLHDFGYDGLPLYTVYAHLATSRVWRGQRVEAGETIGTVGETGHASGAHLHFEVRLGENYYFSTRNPELWTVPPEGWGVLTGRLLNSSGLPLYEHPIHVKSVETGQEWTVLSYARDTVNPDALYNENFVLGDLPAGPYEVTVQFVGLNQTAWFFLLPGQTNFVVFKGRSGFQIEPTATPAARAGG
jgi:murein DD-endopeptidase MepM/ murein hydrolase activator NlpD